MKSLWLELEREVRAELGLEQSAVCFEFREKRQSARSFVEGARRFAVSDKRVVWVMCGSFMQSLQNDRGITRDIEILYLRPPGAGLVTRESCEAYAREHGLESMLGQAVDTVPDWSRSFSSKAAKARLWIQKSDAFIAEHQRRVQSRKAAGESLPRFPSNPRQISVLCLDCDVKKAVRSILNSDSVYCEAWLTQRSRLESLAADARGESQAVVSEPAKPTQKPSEETESAESEESMHPSAVRWMESRIAYLDEDDELDQVEISRRRREIEKSAKSFSDDLKRHPSSHPHIVGGWW